MKKYIIPSIILFIDISLYSFRPELTGFRIFFQVIFYISLMSILIKYTSPNKVITNTLLKWTLGIGLLLPIFLTETKLLIIDQFYVADMVILVPILFYELMKKDNTGSRSDVTLEVNNDK